MEGKECKNQERIEKNQERLKRCKRKSRREESALASDRQLCLGQWQWTRRTLWQPQKIQRERRGSKKMNAISDGQWPGGAKQDGLWLCYAIPMAEK